MITIKSYDTTGEQALLRLRDTKGGKGRTVPVPRHSVIDIDRYLDERREHASEVRALTVTAKALVFVGNNGRPLTQQFVDSTLRRCCDRAAIGYPDGAMAHALRHHYGTQLALRGVPLPVIQQLLGHRNPATTSIYTLATAIDTAGVLHDAGWL